MKFNNYIKAVTILPTILLIIFLSFSNQKEYTKLRILIWNTPSLTLGKYLAISTATGFILSYLITTKLAKFNGASHATTLKFRDDINSEQFIENTETINNVSYDYTLIERDIKDPSPTINANFRIIGMKDKSNINYRADYDTKNPDPIEFDEQYDDQLDKNESFNQVKSVPIDWNDESYSKW